MINKFIEELDLVKSSDLSLNDFSPLAVNTGPNIFKTFKASMWQLQELLHLKPTAQEVFDILEKDPSLTNMIFSVNFDKLLINYDETDLQALEDLVYLTINPFLEKVKDALVKENSEDFYILRDEIPKLIDAIDATTKIPYKNIFFPDVYDTTKPPFDKNNYGAIQPSYAVTIDGQFKIVNVYRYVKNDNEAARVTFKNPCEIAQQYGIVEFRFFIFRFFPTQHTSTENLINLQDFFMDNVFLFEKDGRKILTLQNLNSLTFTETIEVDNYSFSVFFDKNGFLGSNIENNQSYVTKKRFFEKLYEYNYLYDIHEGEIDANTLIFIFVGNQHKYGQYLQLHTETEIAIYSSNYSYLPDFDDFVNCFLRINFNGVQGKQINLTVFLQAFGSRGTITFEAPRGIALIKISAVEVGSDANISYMILSEDSDQDLTGYVQTQYLTDNYYNKPQTVEKINELIAGVISGGTIDLSDYVTQTEFNTQITTINDAIANISNQLDVYTKPEIDEFLSETVNINTFNTLASEVFRKSDAVQIFDELDEIKRNADKYQSSIPIPFSSNVIASYQGIPNEAVKKEFNISISSLRDFYLGEIDTDLDNGAILHLVINVTADDVTKEHTFSGGKFYQLGQEVNNRYEIFFKHNNSKVSNIRDDLKGTIVSSLRNFLSTSSDDNIMCGTRLVSQSNEKVWMHPIVEGPNTRNRVETFVNKPQLYGYNAQQQVGITNIQYCQHSTLCSGQLPLNIVFSLKNHRAIYFEIRNEFAPSVNVTFTFQVKDDSMAWIQQNISYKNSIFLIFTNSVARSIPNELLFIVRQFRKATRDYIDRDQMQTIDGIELPTINGVLAYTCSVFPDFFATTQEPLKCTNGYLDHPSNFYFYIVMRCKQLIYRVKQTDYISYQADYDGRTIDLNGKIRFIASTFVSGSYTEKSYYLSNACSKYSLSTSGFEKAITDVCFKYILRKGHTDKLIGWSENILLKNKDISGIIPNSYIIYLEPDSIKPSELFTTLKCNFSLYREANDKIVEEAKKYDTDSTTKWIAVFLILYPYKQNADQWRALAGDFLSGAVVYPQIFNESRRTRTYDRVNTAIYQGEFLETFFRTLDKLPDNIVFSR